MAAKGGNLVKRVTRGGRFVTSLPAGQGGTPVTDDGGGGEFVTDDGKGGDFVWFTGCFPKSELVYVDFDVHIPIGTLKMGDRITSWDMEQEKTQYTTISKIHKYTIKDIICFNNALRVSSSHPFMVVENGEYGILIPKWKIAFEINVGDCVVGVDGKLIDIKSKSNYWYSDGIEVLNLSTDKGVPFMVGDCIVRADNAKDNIMWADAPLTQMLSVA